MKRFLSEVGGFVCMTGFYVFFAAVVYAWWGGA